MSKYRMSLSKIIDENTELYLFDFILDWDQFKLLKGFLKYWTFTEISVKNEKKDNDNIL